MTDSRPPRLNFLYFYLTSYCNLRCIHCWLSPKYLATKEAPEEAPLALLKEILDQALPLGLRHVKITGGEPFLSKEIFNLISYASSRNLEISIETNGTLIDEKRANFLKEKRVRFIAVSIDGPDETVYAKVRGEKASFHKAIKGIKAMKKMGLDVQIIASIYKGNVKYLEDMIKLAEGYKVNSIKVNRISTIGRGDSLKESGKGLSVRDYIDLDSIIDNEIQPRYKVKILLDIPMAFKGLKNIKERRSRCGIKNILGVLSDGRISICGIGESVNSLVLGDVRKEPLKKIWEESLILRDIREGLPARLEGICGRCVFKAYCLGKCRAEAYYIDGNLFGPFSFCEEAFRLGLFPKERLLGIPEVLKKVAIEKEGSVNEVQCL